MSIDLVFFSTSHLQATVAMATENDHVTENTAGATTAAQETPIADAKGKGKATATAEDVPADVAMDEDDDDEDDDEDEVSSQFPSPACGQLRQTPTD